MFNNSLKSPSSNLERKPETNYEHIMINRKYGAARNGNHTLLWKLLWLPKFPGGDNYWRERLVFLATNLPRSSSKWNWILLSKSKHQSNLKYCFAIFCFRVSWECVSTSQKWLLQLASFTDSVGLQTSSSMPWYTSAPSIALVTQLMSFPLF